MSHRGQPVVASLLLLPLLATCEGVPPDGFEVVEGEQAMVYEIDFNSKPPYMKNNELVLTFDDGPDGTYTAQVLDILKEKGVKATFFINSNNNSNLATNTGAQNLVKRMVNEGHELASHTARHIDLAAESAASIEQELVGVENAVKNILGENGPKMTMVRAPFGRPYQSAYGSEAYKKVSAVVSKHAVHIGWNLDSNDWMFQGDANRVYNNVTGLIKTPGAGAYGVILMHSINPQTVGALPRLIDYMRMNGFVFKLTEDAVRGKFGKSSAELLGMAPSGTGGSGGGGGSTGTGGTGGSGGSGGSPVADAGVVEVGSNSGGSVGSGGAGGATVAVDAGKPSTGGTGGTGGSKSGTGGSGGSTSDPEEEPPTTGNAPSGGCSYGGAPGAGTLAFVLGLLMLARRRRR
jgi:MYXO-CTERM domain-containing protein